MNLDYNYPDELHILVSPLHARINVERTHHHESKHGVSYFDNFSFSLRFKYETKYFVIMKA